MLAVALVAWVGYWARRDRRQARRRLDTAVPAAAAAAGVPPPGSIFAQRWVTPSCSRLGAGDPSCATGPPPPSATPTNR